MASLVQFVLVGFIAIILIATALNLVIAPELPLQLVLLRTFSVVLIIGFPLLRRGYFRGSVILIITLFFLLETFVVTSAPLRKVADTLLFFTLTILLAGLLLSRRALVSMFVLSAGVIVINALRESNSDVKLDRIVIAGNFILLNGLMGLFLDQLD